MGKYIKVPDRLYLDKFCIALYDKQDNIYGVYDNPLDLAKSFDIDPRWAYKIVGDLFKGKKKSFRKLVPHFINFAEKID